MKSLIGKFLTRRCLCNPIFVVGASRSGTSVLLQALGKHPQILSMPGEAPFITSIGGNAYLFEFSDARNYYKQSLKFPLEYLYDFLRRLCFEYAGGKNYGLKILIKGLREGDISYLSKRYWCAKTFPNYQVAKGLLRLYANAKFIYIIRNGCDVVHSRTKFSGFRQQVFEEQCRAWAESVEKYRFLLDLESGIQVRHEQIMMRSEESFHCIFRFLGVEDDKEPIRYIKSNIVHPLDKSTQKDINVKEIFGEREPPFKKWSSEQRNIFKSVCGAGMRELGYDIPF